jgi:predicted site-specific integrase-resolvase
VPKDQYQAFKEVADRLKVAEAALRHWTKEGQRRAIDIDKRWRIPDADLADFLLAHQTAPKRPRAVLNDSDPQGGTQCRS